MKKAILDYSVSCEKLTSYIENMLIGEERLFTLTKYVTTRGIKDICTSDHNPLFCSFDISYEKKAQCIQRREIFDLKCKEGQAAFKQETDNTTKFTDVFENNNDTFEAQTLKFQRCLKQSVQNSFRKIRITNKEKETEVAKLLKLKNKLNIFLEINSCNKSIKRAQNKLKNIEMKIQE